MGESEPLRVEARDNEIVVTAGSFCAVYFKPADQPQLILRSRTDTDDYALLAQVWQEAVKKARELGWIV